MDINSENNYSVMENFDVNKISIEVVKMESPKCPRCYLREGIEDNFMGMCDRCCTICLEAKEDFVTFKMLTEEEAERLANGIIEARKKQLLKYRVDK